MLRSIFATAAILEGRRQMLRFIPARVLKVLLTNRWSSLTRGLLAASLCSLYGILVPLVCDIGSRCEVLPLLVICAGHHSAEITQLHKRRLLLKCQAVLLAWARTIKRTQTVLEHPAQLLPVVLQSKLPKQVWRRHVGHVGGDGWRFRGRWNGTRHQAGLLASGGRRGEGGVAGCWCCFSVFIDRQQARESL